MIYSTDLFILYWEVILQSSLHSPWKTWLLPCVINPNLTRFRSGIKTRELIQTISEVCKRYALNIFQERFEVNKSSCANVIICPALCQNVGRFISKAIRYYTNLLLGKFLLWHEMFINPLHSYKLLFPHSKYDVPYHVPFANNSAVITEPNMLRQVPK